MSKLSVKQKRTMSYFIEATKKIIDKEGIENVSIRKVSALAGYNSATLYNYFENLDHLIFFASIDYMKAYWFDLPNYINKSTDSLTQFYKIWECFCYHSLEKPKIYRLLFFSDFCESIDEILEEYFYIFPDELEILPENLKQMIMIGNIYNRDKLILESFVDKGLLKEQDLDKLNEIILLMYEGLLNRVINNNINSSIGSIVSNFLDYLHIITSSFINVIDVKNSGA